MKTYIQIFILFVMFVFGTCCQGQDNTDLPKDDTRFESTGVFSTYGPSSITRTIKQDKKGNIWFATWEGIIRYDGTFFTNVTSKVSLSRFFSVLIDRNGNFWFGSIGAGVYYYDGKSFRNITTKDGLASDRVTHIYEDKTGNIWFGTEGGASRYDGNSFRNFTTKEGLPNNDVNSIIEDKTGRFWIGTRGDACIYDGKTFTRLTTKEGHSFENIRSIIEDKKGNIWLGGSTGLWRYDGASFTNYTTKFVGNVYEDSKGNILTSSESTTSAGWTLSRYDEQSLLLDKPTVIEIKTQEGMFFGILEDTKENVWFGTLDGVYRYDGNTFNDFKNNGN